MAQSGERFDIETYRKAVDFALQINDPLQSLLRSQLFVDAIHDFLLIVDARSQQFKS